MTFAHPTYLYIMPIPIVLLLIWYILKLSRMQASFQFSSSQAFVNAGHTWRVYLRHLPFVLRLVSIALLFIVLARPQSLTSTSETHTEGIDIILAIDVSGSMLTEDFTPNRLEATKAIAEQFIVDRPNDNIGLVVFAGESYTQCPLTSDHTILLNMLQQLRYGYIQDGTAIGMGLGTSINRLKNSTNTKSRVVILLTDGSNNAGEIPPLSAAEMAHSLGIRVYTIAVGRDQEATIIRNNRPQIVRTDIDSITLQQIASITGGEYFRATNNTSLSHIYKQIDQMEKHRIVTNSSQKKELFLPFAWIAFCLLIVEWLLSNTLLRRATV